MSKLFRRLFHPYQEEKKETKPVIHSAKPRPISMKMAIIFSALEKKYNIPYDLIKYELVRVIPTFYEYREQMEKQEREMKIKIEFNKAREIRLKKLINKHLSIIDQRDVAEHNRLLAEKRRIRYDEAINRLRSFDLPPEEINARMARLNDPMYCNRCLCRPKEFHIICNNCKEEVVLKYKIANV